MWGVKSRACLPMAARLSRSYRSGVLNEQARASFETCSEQFISRSRAQYDFLNVRRDDFVFRAERIRVATTASDVVHHRIREMEGGVEDAWLHLIRHTCFELHFTTRTKQTHRIPC